jgi:hypothetical protein
MHSNACMHLQLYSKELLSVVKIASVMKHLPVVRGKDEESRSLLR